MNYCRGNINILMPAAQYNTGNHNGLYNTHYNTSGTIYSTFITAKIDIAGLHYSIDTANYDTE